MFKKKNETWHIVFFFILSLNYLIPLIIFKDFTLFYKDSLDSEIVYNFILGKILAGDNNSINLLLNGEIQAEYLRRLYQPFSYLYAVLNVKTAYWLIDVLVKLVSYFSFLVLAKKINKDLFICCLLSALYASINLPTHEGFGMAILPYITYLCLYKSRLNLKHIIIIIFFGLNSDLVIFGISIPLFALLILWLKDKKNLSNFFLIFGLFILSIFISNINMITVIFEETIFHRVDRFRTHLDFNSLSWFLTCFKIPHQHWDFTFFKNYPFN